MHDLMDAFKALGLHGMASAWPEVLGTARMKSLDHEAVLHQLIKAETAQREVRSMAYQMRVARFPSHRDLAGFDFAHTPIDEALVRQLHTLGFVDSAHNVVLVGGPGTGKTHLGALLLHGGAGQRPGAGEGAKQGRAVGTPVDVRRSGDPG